MKFIIFDDNKWQNFLPFTYTHSVGSIRAGVLKFRQRIAHFFDFETENLIVCDNLINLYKQRYQDKNINEFEINDYIFINSRLRIDSSNEKNHTLKEAILSLKTGEKITSDNELVAFRINLNKKLIRIDDLYEITKSLNETKADISLWHYIWELIEQNGNLISCDYQSVFYEEDNFIEIDPGVTAINPYDIWIGEGAEFKHGVILDATDGPIIIDENAKIMHNVVIVGPVYIGKDSVIKIGAKIYPNTSIGPFCKVGGEVEDTIIQAYSNKQHDGFLGHSFVGEWVNIGADTNNSDLKNTYKNVKVWFYPKNKKICSGSMFVGTIIGDHSKIGINCSINTGTVIGLGVNVYGRDLISDFIPSFSWGEANSLINYQFDKFIETASNVKIRRNESLVSEEIKLIEEIYNNKDRYEVNK